MNDIILEAENLTKSFSYPAQLDLLKGISLKVHKGQSVAIVGKSGEGKTTLLHILGTLDEPTSGKLLLLEQEVKRQNRDRLRNRHLGFVFQAFHLLDDATVLENLLLPLAISRQDLKAKKEMALELLAKLGLAERAHLHALKLSGGEKQRLGIGRAFINNPDLIFADEPTGNLDHQTAAQIQDLLFSWVKEQGKALVVVTHSQELAKQCDATFLLDNGTLRQIGG